MSSAQTTVSGISYASAELWAGAGFSAEEREFLGRVIAPLPLLADLLHADLLLYVRDGAEAVVVAHAPPNPLPSLYAGSQVGRRVSLHERGVGAVLQGGRSRSVVNGLLIRGAPAVQEVLPVQYNGRVLAALSVETNVLEHDRMRRKDPVLRRALARVRQTVLEGRLRGGERLGRLGEHDGLLVVDATGKIRYISTVAENQYRRLGYSESLLHSQLSELDTNEYIFFKVMEQNTCLEQRIEEQDQIWIKRVIPLPPAPRRGWWGRLRPSGEQPEGAIIAIQDITEEVRKEQELKIKSAMIQEIHHRVKNNLQTIASLLRMQARRVRSPEAAEILRQSINRILSVAVVHEFLSHDEASVINIHEVCYRILTEVTHGIVDPEKNIRLLLEGHNYYLPTQQATSCALIVNELLQNAVEHGYAHRNEGTIQVRLRETPDSMLIEICDDGEGLPPGFDLRAHSNLGLQIVQTLVRDDLKGQFELVNGQGVKAVVAFPRWQLRDPPSRLEMRD
ncbi:MAG TPA: histidine kinase N-terminal domain-containing protein [Chloroflexota bacterium]|nr:histidine kinase N-terminal domain-containing protein [Chloroflexota bacterium]HZU04996.1 histidine kinase N-terminal domain-containing protein [Chloroflexota bacterium]